MVNNAASGPERMCASRSPSASVAVIGAPTSVAKPAYQRKSIRLRSSANPGALLLPFIRPRTVNKTWRKFWLIQYAPRMCRSW